MILFRALWIIDFIVAIIALYFFFTGLSDGSITSFNYRLWIFILLALVIILTGSMFLKSRNHIIFAKSLLALLAVPSLLFALFIIIVLITKAKWN
jgi:hypothetical protein